MKRFMIACWKCWFAVLLLILLVATVVIVAGIVPVAASSGHWPWTAWILEFAMERSTTTHSLSIAAPPLDNAALIKRGAGHFDVGCAWCHGSPGQTPSRITMAMTPHAPDLNDQLHNWTEAELQRIVGHGVMLTAMPAWPDANRRDEAWAVVAFLKQYHQLDAAAYEELAGRNEVRAARMELATGRVPEVVVERCVACHGRDGRGREAYPQLAGQSESYLAAAMSAYRSAARHSGIMGPIAAPLSDDQIAAAARYYANLKIDSSSYATGGSKRQQAGQLIATRGVVKQKLAACNACHDASAAGDAADGLPHYPSLDGQRADYLVQQLHLFRAGKRGGSEYHSIMRKVAEVLTDDQIRDLAQYYSSRPVAQ